MTDFIFMVEQTSYMFVTGPDVIKTVTHENITKEELGGASAHHKKSGVSHLTCKDENHCFDKTRELLYFLSKEKKFSANTDSSQRLSSKIESIIPNSAKKPYDVREIIKDIADNNHFMEIQSEYAPNITVGFSEINGQTVGIVANQPLFLAGVLDIDASCKAARFVRFCDSFDIPIITLVDVPGFLPGTNQEHNGIIRHGAKLLFAYCEATTPMITVILRKAYGGAYDVMASKHIRADINLALPYAEIAVMGAEGAVNILHKKSLEQASDADKNTIRQSLMDQYEKDFSSPYQAASRGYIDEIILPSEVRTKIIYYLQLLKKKKVLTLSKKHSNIPL
jgi:propionyl-CoA carboxylase beta chain